MKRRRTNERKLLKTQFEDLSNELIYEIFDYFDYIFLYEIFSKLNIRFYSLLISSTLPIKIHFPLISKSLFQYRCKYLITPNLKRIISLNVCKYFLDYFSIDSFPSVQSLTIDQIPSHQISLILNQLISLTHLSSLSINSLDYFQDENSIYSSIFHLPKLKYCKLTFPSGGERVPLPISTTLRSSIEHLIINGHCRLDQLIAILSYTPKLSHLSCQHLYGSGYTEINFPINLTSMSLILYGISFDELKLFLSKISFQLKILRINKFDDKNYFYAEQWEELIKDFMPNLIRFHFYYTVVVEDDVDFYQRLIEQFSTKFWIERKWLFDYYYHTVASLVYLTFFSINSYKYDQFTIYEQIGDDKQILFGQNFAQHLIIEEQIRPNEYSIQFPRVKKLTLKDIHPEKISLFSDNLQLTQITDLDIKNDEFSIEILSQLPHLQSLTLSNISSLRTKRNRTQQNYKILKLIIDDECDYKHLCYLINLFPHLQSLEISIKENQYKKLLKYLLSKLTSLFSLFLLNVNSQLSKQIENLIQNENLLQNYTIERIHGGLYLWW